MIVSQIVTEYQTIIQILDTLENAVSFAKLNILHNSIIQSEELLIEIKSIQKHLINEEKLPFEPLAENILLFEKIATVKSYCKSDQLIFIIEIPLTTKEHYNYFKIFPLPIQIKDHIELIVPTSKFLIINEQSYVLSNEPCKKVTDTEHLCEDLNVEKKTRGSPCEVQLLKHEENVTNCNRFPINLTKLKLHKLLNF